MHPVIYVERTTKAVSSALDGTGTVTQTAPLGSWMPMVVVFHDSGTPVDLSGDGSQVILRYIVKGPAAFDGPALAFTALSQAAGGGTDATYQLTPWVKSPALIALIANADTIDLHAQITADIPGNPQQLVSLPWKLTVANSPSRDQDQAQLNISVGPRQIWASVNADLYAASGFEAFTSITAALAAIDPYDGFPVLRTINVDETITAEDVTIPPGLNPFVIEGYNRNVLGVLTLGAASPVTLSRCVVNSIANAGAYSDYSVDLQASTVTGDIALTTPNGTPGTAGTNGVTGGGTQDGGAGSVGGTGTALTLTLTGFGTLAGNLTLTGGNGGVGGDGGTGADGDITYTAGRGGDGGHGGDAGVVTLHLGANVQLIGTLTIGSATGGAGGTAGTSGTDGGAGGPSGSTPANGDPGSSVASVIDEQLDVIRGGTYVGQRTGYAPTTAPAGGGVLWYDGNTLMQQSPDNTVSAVGGGGALPPTSAPLTALTGGGAGTLDGIVTAAGAVPTGNLATAVVGGVLSTWQLQTGSTATGLGITRPADYDASTNQRIWVQLA